MRRSLRAGAVVAASAMALGVCMPASAEAASTRGKLKVCFENDTLADDAVLDAVADGPSARSKTLESDKCKTWKVRTGQYRVTMDNQNEFFRQFFNLEFRSALCPDGQSLNFRSEVKRNGDDYDAGGLDLVTNVQKDRKTRVKFIAECSDEENFFG